MRTCGKVSTMGVSTRGTRMGRYGVRQHLGYSSHRKSWGWHFVGFLLLTAVACNIAMLPYPMWFKAVDLIAIPIAILIALQSRGRANPTIENATT